MADEGPSDNYQMLEVLGSGSFGTVYKAIDKATGEVVAVKHIDLESTDEDLQEVQAEISLLSTCASPFVTQYRASFLRGYKLWIVMEYLGGGSCQDLLKPGVFSEAHIAIVCQQILLGLEYLHREGKLHRDIKAANILLSQSGKVKLADFGVAAQLVNIRSLRNTFVGTPFWMAPEVIQQSGYDFKADIWSLGITAMELVKGEPPHAGKHPMKVLMEIPKMAPPRLEGNQYSKEFKDFVAKCLIKDTHLRPSAKELLKHKFIRHAGRTEALQELILRRQEWEAGLTEKQAPRYYAETLRSIRAPAISTNDDEDEGWDFNTVKVAPHHTQKRRKISETITAIDARTDEDSDPEAEVDVFQVRHTDTMRRLPEPPIPQSLPPTVKRSTKKRASSGQQKQPLGVNMSFGNSPSTVRQFRRVSPNAGENESFAKDESVRAFSNHSSMSPSKSQAVEINSMLPPPLPSRAPSTRTRPTSMHSRTSSSSSSQKTKESTLGTLLYTTSIGPICQETLDQTADSSKRDALSRLAEAFSDLESTDPDGLYHIMSGMLQKLGKVEPLKNLMVAALPSSEPKSAQRERVSAGGGGVAAAKLVLAQNNPHLKSHRRRQSVQIQPTHSHSQSSSVSVSFAQQARNLGAGQPAAVGSPRSAQAMREAKEARDDDRRLRELMPGPSSGGRLEGGESGLGEGAGASAVGGGLAEVLFERWSEGLKSRWGGIGGEF